MATEAVATESSAVEPSIFGTYEISGSVGRLHAEAKGQLIVDGDSFDEEWCVALVAKGDRCPGAQVLAGAGCQWNAHWIEMEPRGSGGGSRLLDPDPVWGCGIRSGLHRPDGDAIEFGEHPGGDIEFAFDLSIRFEYERTRGEVPCRSRTGEFDAMIGRTPRDLDSWRPGSATADIVD